jgi:hypothetical protein
MSEEIEIKNPEGFDIPASYCERVFYIDEQGKDARNDIERWRLSLYYKHHYAKTVFFPTELEYHSFLVKYRPFAYATYEEFRGEKRFQI